MTKAPISRDLQIDLMENIKERHDALMGKWVSNKTIANAISEPVPDEVDEISYTRTDSLVGRCA